MKTIYTDNNGKESFYTYNKINKKNVDKVYQLVDLISTSKNDIKYVSVSKHDYDNKIIQVIVKFENGFSEYQIDNLNCIKLSTSSDKNEYVVFNYKK